MSLVTKILNEAEESDRKLGARLDTKTNIGFVTVYRACLREVNSFLNNDYVTLNKTFAVEHAESNHVVNETEYHVLQAIVSTKNVFEAYNLGEYFYVGNEKKGKEIYVSKGPLNYLKEFKVHSLSKLDLAYYGWLYFIAYIYKGVLEIDRWKDDTRFAGGIDCNDAMEWLQKKNLITITDAQYLVKDINNAKKIIKDIFGNPKDFEEMLSLQDQYPKTKSSEYPLSTIPDNIFDSERKKNVYKNGELKSNDYFSILKWLRKYQRGLTGWNNKFTKYKGKVGELVVAEPYILYRGLFFYDKKIQFKEGDILSLDFKKPNLAWSKDPRVAVEFAKGKTNWMEIEKIGPNNTGLVLKHIFDPKDVFLDLEFVGDNNPYLKGEIDFPDEIEVVIPPIKSKFTIWKIF